MCISKVMNSEFRLHFLATSFKHQLRTQADISQMEVQL